MKRIAAALLSLSLLGATQPAEDGFKSGVGVLCMGTFVYIADLQGKACYPGQDSEYQTWLDSNAQKFDAYLIRNFPDGETTLNKFKESQGAFSADNKRLCDLEDAPDSDIYMHIRDLDHDEIGNTIDAMLAKDGKPTWGDCV